MLPSILMGRLINDITERAQKAREKAVSLFPLESWLEIEARIFIAESRQPVNKNQRLNRLPPLPAYPLTM
jgi:hypothetical protein